MMASDSSEEKADLRRTRFRSLANKRTNKALDAIRLIGNLSNKQNYTYQEDEVDKILAALRSAVDEVEQKFAKPDQKADGEFRL